jgi:HK97 family phage major capsid protein
MTAMLISDLRERQHELVEQNLQELARIDSEHRDFTEQEAQALDQRTDEVDRLAAEIERRERIDAQHQVLSQPQGRRTTPTGPEADEPGLRANGALTPTRPRPRIEIPREDAGKAGFRNWGDYLQCVQRYVINGRMDPRLEILNAPGNYGSEGTNADGGFAVPPDFRTAIESKIAAELSLLPRTDQVITTSNAVTVPVDSNPAWATGGITAYWESEGAQKTTSKPLLEQLTVRANKLAVLVPVTDELLEDAPALTTYIQRKAPDKIQFKVNLAIVQGSGVGQPLGILNSPGLIVVAKETGQPPDTLVAANVLKMYSRMYAPSRANAVWLINQSIEPQLFQMFFAIKNVGGTDNVGGVPVYLPANGLAGAPYGTLFGRPVIPTESCETLGDQGDIIFCDLSQYLTVVKGGIRQDVSIHVWFDYDITAFRFVLRVGGQPWWASPVAQRDGSNTLSPFVTLAERP